MQRYTIAVAAVVIGLLARLAIEPLWQVRFPYITLFPAIMVSAWLGGFGPGLLSTLLSALGAAYFWVLPIGHFYRLVLFDVRGRSSP